MSKKPAGPPASGRYGAGGRYRLLTGLSYPTDPKVIARIAGGDHSDAAHAERARSMERHEKGDIVDNIPEPSIPWLLKDGCIEEVK